MRIVASSLTVCSRGLPSSSVSTRVSCPLRTNVRGGSLVSIIAPTTWPTSSSRCRVVDSSTSSTLCPR
jgi:hypothetical protein